MDYVIFGAQGYALGTYRALRALLPDQIIRCFLVSTRGDNPLSLAGLPVKEIGPFSQELTAREKERIQILIATPENVQTEIEDLLEQTGFCNHTKLNSSRWAELMKLYYVRQGQFLPLAAFPAGCHKPAVQVYQACFHRDRPLRSPGPRPEYLIPIQVGSAGTDERTAALTDNTGDHISEKNGNYSELTALYWLWKNVFVSEVVSGSGIYYGLAHYRRYLNLSEEDLLRLSDNRVDVVLPYPMPYEPNIHAHHQRYLKAADWQALLRALHEVSPEYAELFPGILNQAYLYNYNIILAKREILLDYCQWLFPVLELVEELSVPRGWERADRYIGYMGETLETLYFMANRQRYRIVHAECRMLI